MTQAPQFPSKRRYSHTQVSSTRPASVGFETNTRYIRKPDVNQHTRFNNTVAMPVSMLKRKTYIAPDAAVILMPGTIERTTLGESTSNEPNIEKVSISLSQKIKDALHRGSEAYTLYGVDTSEIFTKEIELDENIGITAVERCNTSENIVIQNNAKKRFKEIKKEFETKFKVFAGKLYNIRIS